MLYMLPDHLRVALKIPLGELIPNEERTRSRLDSLISTPLVLVGDVLLDGAGHLSGHFFTNFASRFPERAGPHQRA